MALKSLLGGAVFAETSENPRVLALHGWGRNRTDFSAALDGIPTLAVDLPGFGASPAPAAAIGAEGYAAALEGLLDLFAQPPIIVGHSFGGRVAVCLAAASPNRVSGMVLAGVPLLRRSGPVPQPSRMYRLARWANNMGWYSDQRLESAKRRYGSADYRATTGVMREVLVASVAESYESQLEELSCPVRLLWGEADEAVPLDVARRAAALISDVHLTVVPEAGHHLLLSHPTEVRGEVEALL